VTADTRLYVLAVIGVEVNMNMGTAPLYFIAQNKSDVDQALSCLSLHDSCKVFTDGFLLITRFICQIQQYVTRAATALRNGLKEPAKTQAMKNEAFTYNAAKWESGKAGTKKAVQVLSEAGL
jgi:hypothetical protein